MSPVPEKERAATRITTSAHHSSGSEQGKRDLPPPSRTINDACSISDKSIQISKHVILIRNQCLELLIICLIHLAGVHRFDGSNKSLFYLPHGYQRSINIYTYTNSIRDITGSVSIELIQRCVSTTQDRSSNFHLPLLEAISALVIDHAVTTKTTKKK